MLESRKCSSFIISLLRLSSCACQPFRCRRSTHSLDHVLPADCANYLSSYLFRASLTGISLISAVYLLIGAQVDLGEAAQAFAARACLVRMALGTCSRLTSLHNRQRNPSATVAAACSLRACCSPDSTDFLYTYLTHQYTDCSAIAHLLEPMLHHSTFPQIDLSGPCD